MPQRAPATQWQNCPGTAIVSCPSALCQHFQAASMVASPVAVAGCPGWAAAGAGSARGPAPGEPAGLADSGLAENPRWARRDRTTGAPPPRPGEADKHQQVPEES